MTGKFNPTVRLHRVIFVALAILLAFANASPVTTDSKMISVRTRTVQQGFHDNSHYDQNTRHLKARKHTLDDEERGNIPVISKLADKISKKPKSQEEVFKLFTKMQLVNEKANLFENPQFLKWTSAVTKGYKDSQAADMAIALTLAGQRGGVSYVKKIEENPYKLLLSKMRARDSDDIVATYIWSAKRDVLGSTIAQKVEDVLLDSWMPQSADEVFKLLKLNTGGSNLFNYPRLSSWVSYVTKLEGKQADEQMYTVLRAAYGDDELATILAASKQFALGDVAKRLEEVQHKVGLIEGKTAQRFFTNLKLNTQGDKLFESPALHSWVDYVTKLSPKNADELMLSTLKAGYKDDLVLVPPQRLLPKSWSRLRWRIGSAMKSLQMMFSSS
ncbi:hypothetical protein PF010_g28744 [Phytophthora fragariae]|uniref:RxLR effector protein n=1 Tax=Phytophthora fragariae TaxID=53985 RepID=A0A6A3HA68_9STRA|nr:hypothetical protein PF011_g28131 [Phytophthora fragariae]KAE9064098.1 hypothetical protein PF010_g28744 [Phytophthora fragariae]